MVPVPLSRLQPSRKEEIEDWPWLDQAVLRASRSRQVCMTCHFFPHHPGSECNELLSCSLRRQRGWAPGGGVNRAPLNRPPLSPREGWLSDGRHVLHFRPTLWDRWSQRLEVTVGELLPDQSVPLLKRRMELTREEALKLWGEKRQQGWQACEPQWALAPKRQPRDRPHVTSMGRSASPPCF